MIYVQADRIDFARSGCQGRYPPLPGRVAFPALAMRQMPRAPTQEPTIWGLALPYRFLMLLFVASSAIFPRIVSMTKPWLMMFVAAGCWSILPANGEVANAPKVTVPPLEVQGGEFRLGDALAEVRFTQSA